MKHQLHFYALLANKMKFLNHIYNSSKTLRVVIDESINNSTFSERNEKKTEMHAERLCIHALEGYCLYGNSSKFEGSMQSQPKSGEFL